MNIVILVRILRNILSFFWCDSIFYLFLEASDIKIVKRLLRNNIMLVFLIVFRIDYIIHRRISTRNNYRGSVWIINWFTFFHVVPSEADILFQSIARISMVDDSTKSGMVKRARDERRRKRRWLPGGRWRTLLQPPPHSLLTAISHTAVFYLYSCGHSTLFLLLSLLLL